MPIHIDPISYSSFYRTSSNLFRSLLLWQCSSTEPKILRSICRWRSLKHSVKAATGSPGTGFCRYLLFRQASSSIIQIYGWNLKIPKTKISQKVWLLCTSSCAQLCSSLFLHQKKGEAQSHILHLHVNAGSLWVPSCITHEVGEPRASADCSGSSSCLS